MDKTTDIERTTLCGFQQKLKGRYIDQNISPKVAHALAFMWGTECDGGRCTVSSPLKYVASSFSGQMVLRTLLGDNDTDDLIQEFFTGLARDASRKPLGGINND